MIRDPIARFESFYYFSRFGNNLGGGGHAKLTDERRAESIDECVSKRRPECKNPWWQIVPYICGHHPACSKRSQEAVDIAKVRKTICSKTPIFSFKIRIFYVSDFFVILVTFQCEKSVTNISNRSPTSVTCRQQKL